MKNEKSKALVLDFFPHRKMVTYQALQTFGNASNIPSSIINEKEGTIVLASRNEDLSFGFTAAIKKKRSEGKNLHFVIVPQPTQLIPTLLSLYKQRKKPALIVFDFKDPYFNFFDFIYEIRVNLHYYLFRRVPLFILNYEGEPKNLIPPIKVFGLNASPRLGTSEKLLKEHINKYWTDVYYDQLGIGNLPHMKECTACGGHQKKCVDGCNIKDDFWKYRDKVDACDVLIIAAPVYMDAPTPRLMAFLSRLTSSTKFNRLAFIGKKAHIISTGYCSGTKAVISQVANSLELMGFDIGGRSSFEKIQIWNDEKVRGGVPDDFVWPD